jgi:hypothetical protein
MTQDPNAAEPRRSTTRPMSASEPAAAAPRAAEPPRTPRAAREYGEAMVYAGAPALSPTRYFPAVDRATGARGTT